MILMIFFFFFFRKIFISVTDLFQPFLIFFFRKILYFSLTSLQSFYFIFTFINHFYTCIQKNINIFIYLQKYFYRLQKKKSVKIRVILVFILIFFIRVFFIRIFSIRIRRKFYIINNILGNPFFLNNIFTFF